MMPGAEGETASYYTQCRVGIVATVRSFGHWGVCVHGFNACLGTTRGKRIQQAASSMVHGAAFRVFRGHAGVVQHSVSDLRCALREARVCGAKPKDL